MMYNNDNDYYYLAKSYVHIFANDTVPTLVSKIACYLLLFIIDSREIVSEEFNVILDSLCIYCIYTDAHRCFKFISMQISFCLSCT